MVKRRAAGEGSIYYREDKGLWVAQVFLPNGKKKTKSSKKQKVVKDWLIEMRQSVNDGTYIEKDKVTVAQFLENYIENVAAHSIRPNTLKGYRDILKYHILPEVGHLKLVALEPLHLQTLYARKVESGLSKRTVQLTHSVIHQALRQALEWGLVNRNVADIVKPPKPARKIFPTWTAGEVKRFLEAVRDDRWYALYVTATVGLREGEILALKWENINLLKGNLQVKHALNYIPGEGLKLAEPKSDTSRRMILIPSYVVSALKEHQLKQEVLRKIVGEAWVEDGYVFTTNLGTPISARNLVRHFKKIIEENGLPEIRFHDLRHTTATLLLQANANPKQVQALLGHSQISLTMDTYAHVTQSMLDDTADKLADIMSG